MHSAGVVHPAPVPRLSRTPAQAGEQVRNGQHSVQILRELGLDEAAIAALREAGAIA
ncbi:hypothetical protein D3C79_1028830 [compost metagenome]